MGEEEAQVARMRYDHLFHRDGEATASRSFTSRCARTLPPPLPTSASVSGG
jgi:hypothetical protein